jgi:orotidine-5'-phosphate decarboxylase
MRDALCVALDSSDRQWIGATAAALAPHVGWLKLGLEAFTAHGPDLVAEIAALSSRVFLDLKLHDIPATVRRAATNCAASGAALLTVHAAGGPEMLRAAVEGVCQGAASPRLRILAVTVLTSIDRAVLHQLGVMDEPAELVQRWTRLARQCGVDGVVCSAQETAALRAAGNEELLIVTPGIRPALSAADDQRRVVTPRAAVAAGADILVVGRPITAADDPLAAARRVLDEMTPAS